MPSMSSTDSSPAFCYSRPVIIRPHPVKPESRSQAEVSKDGAEEYEQATESIKLTGGCFCGKLKYRLHLQSKDDARTSLCHCRSCKKAFGGAFGVTIKVPLRSFRYLNTSGIPTLHHGDNGSGVIVHREFCNMCGSYTCEYGEQAKETFRYIALGSLDEPSALPPKGEFFCSQREQWMPEIPGIFHKQHIKD